MSTVGSDMAGAAKGLRRATALASGALLATMMSGCSGDASPKAASGSRSPNPPASASLLTNPLTGLGAPPKGPVIAVKLDDTAAGRPSLGLDQADVIYIEEVEGGLSRMVAVFASAKPKVRAVRSIRASDIELLGQYGRVIVVASGGKPSSLRDLDRSTLHGVINDRKQVGFVRDPSRPAPYNVVSDLARVSAAVKADGVRTMGFSWAASDPRLAGARTAPRVLTRVGRTRVSFVWNPKLAAYVRTVDGRRIVTGSGAPVAKPNVLVQFCTIKADPNDVDVNHNPTMLTRSVGTGRVVLFRNGKRLEGRWSRPSSGAPTAFTDRAGKPLLLAPGGTFVALVRTGAPV